MVRSGKSQCAAELRPAARSRGVLATGARCPGVLAALVAAACSGTPTGESGSSRSPSSDAQRRYPLHQLPTATIRVGEHEVRVWLAQDFDPLRPGVVAEGLMFVRPEEIADDQGMLFVFADERVRSFWMMNTITPLDIAFARFDGTIVTIHRMPPRTLESFSSYEPAMFALEMKQGSFARLGIREGDKLQLPPEVFRTAP